MLENHFQIAVPTAFMRNEELNIPATRGYLAALYARGVRSVLVSGSTGEQNSMTVSERIALARSINADSEISSDLEITFGAVAVRQRDVL